MRGTLDAGYAETFLTPPLGVDLCGYGFHLERRAVRVGDDLMARALHLRRNGRDLVIIACDLIGFSVADADEIRAAVSLRLGLPREAVLLSCTHTHSGPATHGLPGLGSPDPAYLLRARRRIVEAAEAAGRDLRPAVMSWAFETVEPIGFNRRAGNFQDLDAVLKTAVFERSGERLHLWSYACHPVVLGPKPVVSADWPGAAARALGARGRRGLFLQGFCGDVDPVTQLNRWGEGTPEDLEFYGELVARRLLKAERLAAPVERPDLRWAEARTALPLQVYGPARIARQAAAFTRKSKSFPGGRRFAAEWKARALAGRAALARAPRVRGVPVQALAIGPLRIAALPGEIFGEIGLALRERFDPLIPAGLANGVVGYVPSRSAYADPADYAAWCAPMFYGLFPFTPDAGAILERRAAGLLKKL